MTTRDQDATAQDLEAAPATPPLDDKDWTWTLERPCPECGFDAAMIEPVAIPALVRDAVSRWPDVLSRPDVSRRPTPTTWSPLEYACHVRDVCTIFTDRLQLMLDEDEPRFANWDQDETALAQRYWEQDPETVSVELTDAGERLATAYTRVGEDDWKRAGIRSNGSEFTVESLGRYLLHDLFHHVWDVQGLMPVVEAKVVVPVPPEVAFWVSQTTAPLRYRWDPFVHEQHLMGGATVPDKGVRTVTVSRHRLRMVSEYVSFNPPRNVGMKMVTGPWFFAKFGGGWRFEPGPEAGSTLATWRYNFGVRPSWIAPVADRVGVWLLGRDIRRRIAGYAGGCVDPVVVEAAEGAAADRAVRTREHP